MSPASIQLSNDSFHQKHIGKNTPLKISMQNYCRSRVSTCVRWPRYDKIADICAQRSYFYLRFFINWASYTTTFLIIGKVL